MNATTQKGFGNRDSLVGSRVLEPHNAAMNLRDLCCCLLLVGSGCSHHNETAPPLADCTGEGCKTSGGGSVRFASGTGGQTSADAGTTGNTLSVTAVTFADNGAERIGWSMSSTTKLVTSVSLVYSKFPSGTLTASGASPITITKVNSDAYSWLSATPSIGTGYLASIISIAGVTGGNVNIPLLRSDSLNFVPTLMATSAMTLDSSKAQVVVKVVDAQGLGVAKARIRDLAAGAIAYSSNGSWVEQSLDPVTDISGRVVIVNLTTGAVPGSFATVTAYADNSDDTVATSTVLLPVQAGFVTYGTIPLTIK